VADHAQTPDRFRSGELSAAAIDGFGSSAFEFAQAILNGVESSCMRRKNIRRIMKLKRVKATMAEGSKVARRALRFELAPLLQRPAVQQFAKTAATRRGL